MKKIKQWFKTHWFSTTVILVSVTLSCLSAYYAWNFSKSTKDVEEKRAIFQLAITAIAASVGIGTIVNSARSASISAESMKLTKEKDIREQSSHLVVSSTLTKFGVSPPMYNNEYVYSPSGIHSKFSNELKEELSEGEQEYVVVEESAMRTVDALILERLFKDKPLNQMNIINIGKGASINLEISFEFLNKKDFHEYSAITENKAAQPVGVAFYPSYDLSVSQNEKNYSIEIVDNTVLYYLKYINSYHYQTGFYHEVNLFFENSKAIKYTDFLKPQDSISFPIPNEFTILCKHYAIVHYYKKLNKSKRINSFVLPNIQHLISSETIKPLGRLIIKYYEEKMVKENYYEDLKKKEIRFDIKLKDDSISVEDTDLNFYLEVTPVPVKEMSKAQKKRAYY